MCWMTWHHDICSCDGASQTKWLSDTRAKRKGWSLLKTDVILALRFGDRRLIGHLAAEQAGFSDGTSKSDVSKASFKWFWQTHIAVVRSTSYYPWNIWVHSFISQSICFRLVLSKSRSVENSCAFGESDNSSRCLSNWIPGWWNEQLRHEDKKTTTSLGKFLSN